MLYIVFCDYTAFLLLIFSFFLEVRNEPKIKDMLNLLVFWWLFFKQEDEIIPVAKKELNKEPLFCSMNWGDTLYSVFLLMFFITKLMQKLTIY